MWENIWENIIEDSITNIPSTYGENELAFLAIQSKIELQLRDKIHGILNKTSMQDHMTSIQDHIT